jgi:hypothetical protein
MVVSIPDFASKFVVVAPWFDTDILYHDKRFPLQMVTEAGQSWIPVVWKLGLIAGFCGDG